MRLPQPLLLRVEFAFDLENASYIVGQIVGPLQRTMFRCCYGKRSLAFLIITEQFDLVEAPSTGRNFGCRRLLLPRRSHRRDL